MTRWQTPLRFAFGLFLVLNALNHYLGAPLPEPVGSQPLAAQLLTALHHSRLYDVAMGFELTAGILLLVGSAEPFALAVAMPIQVCALFWALVLEHSPLWSALALLALLANAALMWANLPAYRGVLQRRALAQSEGPELGDNYDGLYMHVGKRERLTLGQFVAAATVLLAALIFYWYFVPSITGTFARFVILVPAVLLLLRAAGVKRRG
ncbi:MAG: hypothetical protein ABIT16_05955 [Croceibacterium sp.]